MKQECPECGGKLILKRFSKGLTICKCLRCDAIVIVGRTVECKNVVNCSIILSRLKDDNEVATK